MRETSRLVLRFFFWSLLLSVGGQPLPAQETGVPTFRTGVSDVLVPTLVTDPQGNIVFGLQAQDFVIRDNGIPQQVRMDETFSFKPISLVVAVETGGRAPSVIGSGCALQRESDVFTRRTGQCKSTLHGIAVMLETFLNVPGSEMALVSFDSAVKLRQDFSADISAVTKSLDTLPGGDSGGAVLDAVQFSLNLLKRRPADHRKVLFVISGQRDQGSKTVTLEEAARQIAAGNVEVYMVAYPPDLASEAGSVARLFGPGNAPAPGSPGPPGVVGPGSGASSAAASFDILGLFSLLRSAVAEPNIPQTIANLTGGEYVLFKNTKNLDEALGLLANHVHNRYQLSFTARNPAPGPHKLEVGLRGGGSVIISARAGYWPAEAPSQSPK